MCVYTSQIGVVTSIAVMGTGYPVRLGIGTVLLLQIVMPNASDNSTGPEHTLSSINLASRLA